MAFENMDSDTTTEPEDVDESGGVPPEESSNRNFLIVAGILGGVLVLMVICLVLYVVLQVLPQRGKNSQAHQAETQNAIVMDSTTKTAQAGSWTATPTTKPTATPVTPTLPATETPVVKPTSTATPPNQKTLEALNAALETQKAAAAKPSVTITLTPNSTLTGSGFVEQVGAPGLLGLAVVLIIVIFLARRLRTAN